MTHFLFPSHPMRQDEVDPTFVDQWDALQAAGLTVSLCPDATWIDGRPLRNVPVGATVVYRGWMLTPAEYGRLSEAIVAVRSVPITTLADYLLTHYLPNWYPALRDVTPETHVLAITPTLESDINALGWDAYFLKDYVKSLKTGAGSVLTDPSRIDAVLAEMRRVRGEIEGGLCVRRVEPFLAETERRYFVIDGRAFSASGEPPPAILHHVAERITSRFFSVDVVRRDDGELRVVEIGDGQVSDLVGWTPQRFADCWIKRIGSD